MRLSVKFILLGNVNRIVEISSLVNCRYTYRQEKSPRPKAGGKCEDYLPAVLRVGGAVAVVDDIFAVDPDDD